MIYAVPRRYSKAHSFAAPGARLHGQRGEHLVQEPRGVTRGHGASGHVSMDWKGKSKPETMGKPHEIGYTLWLFNIAMENPLYMEVLMGKPSTNGPFSMAMLNNQMVGRAFL